MDQRFTAEQWKLAEAPAMKAISVASGSARGLTEMLRLWDEIHTLAKEHGDTDEAFFAILERYRKEDSARDNFSIRSDMVSRRFSQIFRSIPSFKYSTAIEKTPATRTTGG